MFSKKLSILLSLLALTLCLWVTPTFAAEIIDGPEIYQAKPFYPTVEKSLESLHQTYPSCTKLEVIGQSLDNRNLTAIKVGHGPREIFINGAHHGREYMTTVLLLDQIESLAFAYENNQTIDGLNVRSILDKVSIWFLPLVNPDGVELVTSGPSSSKGTDLLYSIVSLGFNFKTWKANGRGVDLNSNYPTDPASTNKKTAPSSANYPGPTTFSEPETQAIHEFTLTHDFETVVSYHSSGKIIYWYFGQTGQLEQDSLQLGRVLNQETGYPLIGKSQSMGGRGYKDWFIQQFHKPGYTIEIGNYSHGLPVPVREYNEVLAQNKDVPLKLAYEVTKLYPYTSYSVTPWNLAITADKQTTLHDLYLTHGAHVAPLRLLCDELEITLSLLENGQLRCTKGSITVTLIPNSHKVFVNGQPTTATAPTGVFQGVTYIDLRHFLSSIDHELQLDYIKQEFQITAKG